MIHGTNDRAILVHVDDPEWRPTQCCAPGKVCDAALESSAAIRWYSHNSKNRSTPVFAILPERFRLAHPFAAQDLGSQHTIWYGDDHVVELPDVSNNRDVWLINGSCGVLVDISHPERIARKRDCDVLVLAHPDSPHAGYNEESVLVDHDGRVIQIRRHYLDSPLEADCCAAPATGLICSARIARTITAHIVNRGWGLDSIGGLTRRFRVEWTDISAASPVSGYPSLGSGTVSSAAADTETLSGFRTDARSTSPSTGEPAATESPRSFDLGSTEASFSLGSDSTDSHTAYQAKSRANDDAAAEDTGTPDLPEGTARRWADPSGAAGYLVAKRAMDITFSLAAICCSAPLMVAVAVLVKLTSRGPVLFGHPRQGLNGREFRCLKFRTMCVGADVRQKEFRDRNEVNGPQFKITNDPRLTSVGGWLRRYNLDELPQFFNVLMGQMSIVGPRPSPDAENQYCPAWRRARLAVKPGITGLWQVLRRRACRDSDFQEWIYYDLEYALHCNLRLDWQLLWHTPIAMFHPRSLESFYQELRKRGVCTHSTNFVGMDTPGLRENSAPSWRITR